jgi:hypothetical protein
MELKHRLFAERDALTMLYYALKQTSRQMEFVLSFFSIL